ncbi:MAG: rhomboid family intramembrane serine protease [Hyphomicrobiales bacterium]|nr:rhomboid family intramembrane serine protease [Hyphomicrobiales bacterium]
MITLAPRPASRIPIVVCAIILLNVAVVFYLESLNPSRLLIFMLRNAVVPRVFFEPVWGVYNGVTGDVLPFFTAMFIHGNWLHLGFNMLALAMLGPAMERRFGSVPFAVFYVACGVAASATHVYVNSQSSLPLVGASGAIAGVFAAFVAADLRARPFIVPIPAYAIAAAFLGLQVYSLVAEGAGGAREGGIAWWAHIGGFLAGGALYPLFNLMRRRERPPFSGEPAPAPDDRGPRG